MISEGEILCWAYPVKYSSIEETDEYIIIVQNRIRRRIPKGYYFNDSGARIYISEFYAYSFQHSPKKRAFILNKETKEWRDGEYVEIKRNIPEKIVPVPDNTIIELKK